MVALSVRLAATRARNTFIFKIHLAGYNFENEQNLTALKMLVARQAVLFR